MPGDQPVDFPILGGGRAGAGVVRAALGRAASTVRRKRNRPAGAGSSAGVTLGHGAPRPIPTRQL